ncbi:MAG: hypothetical protein HYW96_00810 [Candidatus Wildermuthbacteria bacterium]|nr:hypothetical protein [Candidatus Wildermuthbacteria bacterium]
MLNEWDARLGLLDSTGRFTDADGNVCVLLRSSFALAAAIHFGRESSSHHLTVPLVQKLLPYFREIKRPRNPRLSSQSFKNKYGDTCSVEIDWTLPEEPVLVLGTAVARVRLNKGQALFFLPILADFVRVGELVL